METAKCKWCGKHPTVKKVAGDLYYVQCGCTKWDPYQFMGSTEKNAIHQWNVFNDKILFKKYKSTLDE